jgi:hypothetical protein
MIRSLKSCVQKDFARIQTEALYTKTYHGTKQLIHEYLDEVCKCLDLLGYSCNVENNIDELWSFIHNADNVWGCTALCLSGGAVNGLHHWAVVKTLLDEGLLPKVCRLLHVTCTLLLYCMSHNIPLLSCR